MKPKYLYEVTEGQTQHYRRHSGYKMITGPDGKRRRTKASYYVPSGRFHGTVYYEVEDVHSADWGDGQGYRTMRTTRKVTVITIEPDTDRELIERRTKAVAEALNELEHHTPPGFMELAGAGIERPKITFVALAEPDVRK